jgi:ribosomal-protein-alanine N-acetyltransferase
MLEAYDIRAMDLTSAQVICGWEYEPPYDEYNIKRNTGYLLDLDRGYLSVFNGHELIGFCCFKAEARITQIVYDDEYLDIGLGLSPQHVGNGRGTKFVEALLYYARTTYNTTAFRLTVADFNERAIKVYERVGFSTERHVPSDFNAYGYNVMHLTDTAPSS